MWYNVREDSIGGKIQQFQIKEECNKKENLNMNVKRLKGLTILLHTKKKLHKIQ